MGGGRGGGGGNAPTGGRGGRVGTPEEKEKSLLRCVCVCVHLLVKVGDKLFE